MTVWDVIVVGAGPAGCAAAYDLAGSGAKVLLVDKSDFPRLKACAGGLTAKAVKALRYSIQPLVQATAHRVHLKKENLASSLNSQEPICVMTVRSELDAYCLAKTIAAGAKFEKISAIKQIERNQIEQKQGGVRLTTADASYDGRFLIGADGASGQTRRLCEHGSWFSQGFALEVQTSMPRQHMDLTFDFSLAGGYAWVFPKRNHLNVGLYSPSFAGKVTRDAARVTRDALLRYVREQLDVEPGEQVTGQYLGMGAGSVGAECMRESMRDCVLLVGDAGGFADALTGEGIYGALVSGQAAAAAILSELGGKGKAADVFAAQILDYRQTLRFSARAAEAFYRHPERGFRAMRLPFVRRTMVKTYTHGLNINRTAMRLALSRC